MQVGHGFDTVVIFIEGGVYYFWSIGFEGLDNGVLLVAVSVKLFIICLHIQYFWDVCILILLEYQYFLLRPEIDIESKGSGGGGGVWSEFHLLLVRTGSGAALLVSPGESTGDLLFLPFCILSNLPLVLGGMGMYLGLGVEEVFASFSITIGASIYAAIPHPPAWLFVAPPPSASMWVLK